MELYEKILIQRICSLEELDPGERKLAKESTEMLAAIAENRVLAGMGENTPPAPSKQRVLQQAAQAAGRNGGSLMSLVTSIFTGKPWYARLAIGVVLLAVVALGWLLPQTPSLAQTNGYMLVYDFGKVSSPDSEDCTEAIDAPLKALETAIREWADERRAKNPDAESNKIAISVNVDNGHMTALVALAEPNQELLDELRNVLAKLDGMPEPTISDATWFHEKGIFDPQAGINMNVFGHFFSFPKGTPEESIEAEVNGWLKENKPDLKASVEVSIEQEGDKERVEIRIKVDEK